MAFNSNKFLTPLFKLFGKSLAGVPPSPANLDIIQFNSTSEKWELASGVVGNAVQSSSNVGSGAGLALPRVLDNLPFKTLVDGVEIVITVSAQELTFTIGAIAISKITGLQVILDSKIETITNVGGEKEIVKAKVGQNVDVRTLKEGTNITIVQNANDLEISATGGVIPTKGKFVMGYHADKNWKDTGTFGAMFTNKADEPIEAEAQGFFNMLYEVVGITVFVSNNSDLVGGTITLKRNSIAIPATTITIPALTTGKFSLVVAESFAVGDEIHEEHICSNDNDIKNTSYYLECEALLI